MAVGRAVGIGVADGGGTAVDRGVGIVVARTPDGTDVGYFANTVLVSEEAVGLGTAVGTDSFKIAAGTAVCSGWTLAD